jgi:hypothetical protein
MSNAFRYLRLFALLIICIRCSVSVSAQQQQWFLFIQSESSQPFYVRIGETVYNSSKVGHLVIDGLRDSTYRVNIGFPQGKFREHAFSIPIRKSDHGFELKKAAGNDWILYNWQTQETITAPRTDSLLYGERKKDNGFAALMASVVNDSAVLYTSVVKVDPPSIPEVNTEVKTIPADTAAIVKQEAEAKTDPSEVVVKTEDSTRAESELVKTETPRPDSGVGDTASTIIFSDTTALVSKPVDEEKTPPIAKLREETDRQEKKLVFLDNTIGIGKDTITVVIPIEKDSVATPEKLLVKEEKETPEELTVQPSADSLAVVKKDDSIVVPKAEEKQADSPLVAKVVMQKTEPPAVIAKEEKEAVKETDTPGIAAGRPDSASVAPAGPEKTSSLVMINSDCVKFATDNDLDKLRIKMMKESDPGNRIFVAHKAFKSMCFATRQIKALSELFPSDELRFRFYETAWPFVSDSSQFKTLEETLTDQFFITRFRTLLRRQ